MAREIGRNASASSCLQPEVHAKSMRGVGWGIISHEAGELGRLQTSCSQSLLTPLKVIEDFRELLILKVISINN